MKHLVRVLAVPLFVPICTAQSFTVAPAAYTSTEGGSFSNSFGVFSNQRLQWAEGELGSTLRVLSGFGMRADEKIASHGRTFSNLSIQLADTDYKTVNQLFSANAMSTPTRVFSAAFTLPTISGSSPGPSPWDSRLEISFGMPFVHTGRNDLLIDMDFVGGRLGNSKAWPRNYVEGYYVDSLTAERTRWGSQTYHGNANATSGCRDSGSLHPTGAASSLDTVAFGPESANPAVKSTMSISAACYWAGPYALVTHAVSPWGNRAGVALPGVTCNKLYVDVSKPMFLLFHQADKDGRSWKVHPAGWRPRWTQAMAGIPLWYQAAWHDTGSGALMLTNATENYIPGLTAAPKRVTVYQYDLRWMHIGVGPYSDSYYFPIIRYRH